MTTEKKSATQRQKFEAAARELETDQSEAAFDNIVKRIAEHSKENVDGRRKNGDFAEKK